MVFLGQIVSTPYGVGKIVEKRENDLVVIPTSWELAYGQKPTFYLSEQDVSPYFSVNDGVVTQYGYGKVDAIREEDGVYVVTLDTWHLATGNSPTLYLQGDNLLFKSSFSVGSKVTCMYGTGNVIGIRADKVILVEPENWVLANNKPPVFYLNIDAVEVVEENRPAEKTGVKAGATTSTTSGKKKSFCVIS
mmetsp:Transcript_10395/g.15801  ORF Transcript_10395/g.15801 Transcript_10395/m.15801 type:complete len:191 (-) Transcript_10395:135-707(-)